MKTFFLFLLLACSAVVVAQNNKEVGLITGNVLEQEATRPLEDVTVKLHLLPDTLSGRSALTDKNGNFEFNNLPKGYYRLVFTSIGFASKAIDSIYIRDERYDFNLNDVKLSRSAMQLQEVIVYAEKPLIENKDGIITYNVSESALSSGSSTAEILKNMPLVSNDPEGGILLKGKEPKILIDDKPTDLNAQQLADLLESLPGSSIERIELMSNPPPQYASEEGGVINIVTRKGKVGMVGRVTASVGTRGEQKIGANISYRQKKFTINLNAGIGRGSFTGTRYSRRENYYTDSTNYFHTDSDFDNYSLRPNIRLQADYDFNYKNSINAVVQTNYNDFDNVSNTQYKNLNRLQDVTKLSTRRNRSEGLNYSNSFNLSYTYKTVTTPEKLQVFASGNMGKNDNDREFFQQFLFADLTPTGVDSLQQQMFDYNNSSYDFRVNYDKPLPWKPATLSTGVAYYYVNNRNAVNTEFYRNASDDFVYNDALSNDFKFLQDIFTARVALTIRTTNKWRFTAGVQAEETHNNFVFLKGNVSDVSSKYFNWLPNATIRKEINDALNTSLVYRATIKRPGIAQLNPNIDYSDPYNIRFGNPFLLPTLAHVFDWNVGYSKGRYYFNTSVGYNVVTDVFNSIRTLADQGITEVTFQNISDRKEYEASVWGGYTFTKRLRINVSAGYRYNEYGEREKQLYKYRDGGSFYTSLNYTYTPNNLLTFEGNARYNSFADPQGRARSNLTTNIGVQHKFFNRRLIVSLNLIDPFSEQKYVTYTYGTRFMLENYNSTNTRNFRFTVAYQLNKVTQKKPASKAKK